MGVRNARERLISKPNSPIFDTPHKVVDPKIRTSPTRMFKVTTPFRLVRSKIQRKNSYQIMEEERLLPDRRDSGSSDETLVNDDDPAGYLLSILAPLIAGIQRISTKLNPFGQQFDVIDGFDRLCSKTLDLLVELKEDADEEGLRKDDLEMKSLMLSALIRKVEAESFKKRSHAQRRPSLIIPMLLNSARSSPGVSSVPCHSETPTPLTLQSENPFVIHASSLSLSSPNGRVRKDLSEDQDRNADIDLVTRPTINRIGSSSRGIPIARAGGLGGTFANFVGGAQSSLWATNIRLGSFQNSLLFSPSPIAVRQVLGGGQGM